VFANQPSLISGHRANVSDTRVWQFAVLPNAEAYCAATPTECMPFLGIAVSSAALFAVARFRPTLFFAARRTGRFFLVAMIVS
jgi:hypothetical protein